MPPGGMPPGGVPDPSGGSQQPYSPLDAVKFGWTKFTQNLVPFLVVAGLLVVLQGGINLGSNLAFTGSWNGVGQTDPATGLPEPMGVGAWLGSVVSGLLASIIGWVLGIVLVRGALDVVDTGRTDLGAMFTRIPWLEVLFAAILVTVVTFIGGLMCLLPGIAAAFLLMFTTTSVVDGESAIDAMSSSVHLTTRRLGETILFVLLAILLVVPGLLTLGIGLLVVIPVLCIGLAYTWRVLQGRPVAA